MKSDRAMEVSCVNSFLHPRGGPTVIPTSWKPLQYCFVFSSLMFLPKEPHSKKPRRPLSRVPSIQSLANIVKETPLHSAKRRLKVCVQLQCMPKTRLVCTATWDF